MFRLFFTYILPLIAPALLYVAWNWMQVRRTLSGKRAEPPPSFAEAPWLLLAGAGISILVITLFGFVLFGDVANTSATYVPPHMENGKLVPAETR